MDMHATLSDYRVEVSGWDVGESFFVEKVTLEVGQPGERVIYLRHPLRPGQTVFLRLLDTRAGYPTFPVAYRVMQVTSAEGPEPSRVVLQKLERRRSASSEAHDAKGATELL